MHPYTLTTSTGLPLRIRLANPDDVPALVALNVACYPTLAEENVVFTAEQFASHHDVFPDGQLVAEADGEIVGAASTLVVDLGRDPYRAHTYEGITDHSWFTNHDAEGDTLYGADVYVHPDWRRQGVAGALYEARRELCRSLNLRRIVVGGRLYNYGRHARRMSAEEYAKRVEAGDLSDPVLGFQLGEGFVLKKVMPHYLKDRRSRDHGAFLEWLNPQWTPTEKLARKVRVTCVQYGMRAIASFEEFENQVEYYVDVAEGYGSDFVLFPELLTAQLMSFIDVKTPKEAIRRLTGFTERLEAMFLRMAREYGVHIVGGSHPTRVGEDIHNVATLYTPRGEVHRQHKIHVTPNESYWWDVQGGQGVQVFDTPKGKVGIAICYDVEFPEVARALVDQGAEILFVPFCTDDRQAYLRVRYCAQARAVENTVYVAIAGNVGNLPQTENLDIQYAQSAVFTPSDYPFARDGIQVQADVNVEGVITCDLDLDVLHRAVHSGTVRPRLDRRGDLFAFDVKGR